LPLKIHAIILSARPLKSLATSRAAHYQLAQRNALDQAPPQVGHSSPVALVRLDGPARPAAIAIGAAPEPPNSPAAAPFVLRLKWLRFRVGPFSFGA
jgi:hypothetical protein